MDQLDPATIGTPRRRHRIGPLDFFVSYSLTDEAWASWIAAELEAAGYQVMIQCWDFVPGTHFLDFIDRGIREASAVVAVLSRSYLSSHYGRLEWLAAMRAADQRPGPKLLPVRVEDFMPDGLLAAITFIDLVGLRDPAAARARLLSRIEVALAGRAKPWQPPGYPYGPVPSNPAPSNPARGNPAHGGQVHTSPALGAHRPAALALAPAPAPEPAGDPAGSLLERIAEVCRARHHRTRIRRLPGRPASLRVTYELGDQVPQLRIAAHIGRPTAAVIDALARLLDPAGAENHLELVYQGPDPAGSLREHARRHGIRLRSFTEFQHS
jgi:hypothetical protein